MMHGTMSLKKIHTIYFIYNTRTEDYHLVQSAAISQKILLVSTLKTEDVTQITHFQQVHIQSSWDVPYLRHEL